MGFFAAGRCHETADLAADAYFGAALPAVQAGSSSYLAVFSKSSGAWLQQTYQVSGSMASLYSSVTAPVPTFATCDPAESFLDGMTLGWGVAAAMLAAWGIAHMRKQVR